MAGFTLRQATKPPMVEKWTKNSTTDTGAIGDIYYWNAGTDAALPGDTSVVSCDRAGILLKATVSGDTYIDVQIPTPDQLWEATSTNASNTTHTGHNMVLSTQNTVNNTGSNSTDTKAIIVQVGTIGATSDNRLRVRFSQMANGLLNN